MKLILTASAADSDTLDVAPSVSASDELIKLILRPIFFSSDQNALFPISAKQSALRPFKMLRGGNQIDIAKPNAMVSLTRSKHRSRLPEEDVTNLSNHIKKSTYLQTCFSQNCQTFYYLVFSSSGKGTLHDLSHHYAHILNGLRDNVALS